MKVNNAIRQVRKMKDTGKAAFTEPEEQLSSSTNRLMQQHLFVSFENTRNLPKAKTMIHNSPVLLNNYVSTTSRNEPIGESQRDGLLSCVSDAQMHPCHNIF